MNDYASILLVVIIKTIITNFELFVCPLTYQSVLLREPGSTVPSKFDNSTASRVDFKERCEVSAPSS